MIKEAASNSKSKMSAGGSSGGGEKFCLKWNEFETNVSTAFRELRDDKDFFDVTLACEGNQLEAHKVILSACSPFFRGVLKRNPHNHPLLYLKGIKYEDVLAVLNFMYHGEVNIAQDELNSFLAVAEDLQVKGLTQNGGAASSGPLPKRPPDQPRPQKQQIRSSPAPTRPPYEPPQVGSSLAFFVIGRALFQSGRYSNRMIRWRLLKWSEAISRPNLSSRWLTLAARMRVEWWSTERRRRSISMVARTITTRRISTRAWGRQALQVKYHPSFFLANISGP